MQTEEILYGTYLDRRFSRIRHVHAVGPWEIVAASEGGRPIVLIVDEQHRRVALRRYDSDYVYMFDLMRLSRTPPDDGDAAGIFAPPNPTPLLSAGAERDWPMPGQDPDASVDLGSPVMGRQSGEGLSEKWSSL